jgi:hypothetical protein
MEVVEFSLTNEVRDQLMDKLRPYVYGKKKKPDNLNEIIEQNLPKEIVDELRHFVNTKGLSTVYVIRNLREVQPEEKEEGAAAVSEDIKAVNKDIKKRWAKATSYMRFIGQAVGDVLNLQKSKKRFGSIDDVIRRYHDASTLVGGALHRDGTDISMLGGVLTEGANTLFVDNTARKETSETQQDEYSQKVLIDHGALAIWANDGNIYHQALNTPEEALSKASKDQLLRIVVRILRNRPQAIS